MGTDNFLGDEPAVRPPDSAFVAEGRYGEVGPPRPRFKVAEGNRSLA